MPQIGSEQKPMMIKGKRKGKKLGMSGKFYKTKALENYKDNYDRIFRTKDMRELQRELTDLNADGG